MRREGCGQLGTDRFRQHRLRAWRTYPTFVAAEDLIGGRLAFAHLEQRPDVGGRVRAIKNDRVESPEAEAKGCALGLGFVANLEALGPIVVANRRQLAKQDLVAGEPRRRMRTPA